MTNQKPQSASEMGIPVIHRAKFHVPFHLADPVGILFFGNFYQVVHAIYEQWAHAQSIWPVWFGAKNRGYPIRHSEADYFKPIRVGEGCEVQIRCKSISDSSFALESELWVGSTLHARVLTVHTAVDLASGKKSLMEDELRQFFSDARTG